MDASARGGVRKVRGLSSGQDHSGLVRSIERSYGPDCGHRSSGTAREWSGGGGGDFSAYEDEFTADSPDVNNRQTFTLTVTASVNANTPSGRNIVGVYRNGNKQKYIASDPGNREYSVPAGNQVTVGGLVTDDEIEIVYGG